MESTPAIQLKSAIPRTAWPWPLHNRWHPLRGGITLPPGLLSKELRPPRGYYKTQGLISAFLNSILSSSPPGRNKIKNGTRNAATDPALMAGWWKPPRKPLWGKLEEASVPWARFGMCLVSYCWALERGGALELALARRAPAAELMRAMKVSVKSAVIRA